MIATERISTEMAVGYVSFYARIAEYIVQDLKFRVAASLCVGRSFVGWNTAARWS
jgi:hypothetical protein